jgi:hypothetical protein
MICSSVNRFRFIVWSFPKGPDSSSTWIKTRGQRQEQYRMHVAGKRFVIPGRCQISCPTINCFSRFVVADVGRTSGQDSKRAINELLY